MLCGEAGSDQCCKQVAAAILAAVQVRLGTQLLCVWGWSQHTCHAVCGHFGCCAAGRAAALLCSTTWHLVVLFGLGTTPGSYPRQAAVGSVSTMGESHSDSFTGCDPSSLGLLVMLECVVRKGVA
jgi:hypothetical protein